MKIIILYGELPKEGNDTYGRKNIDDALEIKKILTDLHHEVEILFTSEQTYLQLQEKKPDVVINFGDDGFRGNPAMEPHVAAILDILNIPYTGNNYLALALCQNKVRAKEILSFHGILTPKFQVFSSTSHKLNPQLEFPLIVKPIREDGSIGIKKHSVVNNEEQLKEQVEKVLNVYSQEALVEEFIDGREFYQVVIGNKRLIFLPIGEVDFGEVPKNAPKILSYQAKWVPHSTVYKKTPIINPVKIDKKLEELIEETTKKCYKILGCRGYARVDYRYDDEKNKLYVLEVNPNADISHDNGFFIRAAVTAGMSYQELLLKIIDLALEKRN